MAGMTKDREFSRLRYFNRFQSAVGLAQGLDDLLVVANIAEV